jgi:DNA-binding IclR family transcriptional regulator
MSSLGLTQTVISLHEESKAGVQGTQAIRRAFSLLKLIAASGDSGLRLSQLVELSGIDRGTARRILTCLVEEEFIDRQDDRYYRLGPASLMLSSVFTKPVPLLQRFHSAMIRLCRRTGDTFFLMMREGDYIYCAHREDGPAKIKIFSTEIGQRRLLGTGTASVAILGVMTEAEISALYTRNAERYANLGIDCERLLKNAEQARRYGHACNINNMEVGVGGVGLAFRIAGIGLGALSIGSLAAKLNDERHQELAELLNEELHQLSVETLSTVEGDQVDTV